MPIMTDSAGPSPTDIAIVTLPPDRWDAYRDLRLAALRTDPIAFGETLDRALAHPDALWRDRLADGDRLLRFAERDGRLVGLAGAIPDDDRPGVALIVSVFVEPSARGRGVARRLVSTLLEELADRDDVLTARLFVNDTNAAAITVYASLGFAVVGVEPDGIQHAGRSYDELIMERPVLPHHR